jgi:hypothetical protein
MVVERGNGSTGRKPCLSPILFITDQIPHGLASDRTQVSAVIKAYVIVVGGSGGRGVGSGGGGGYYYYYYYYLRAGYLPSF